MGSPPNLVTRYSFIFCQRVGKEKSGYIENRKSVPKIILEYSPNPDPPNMYKAFSGILRILTFLQPNKKSRLAFMPHTGMYPLLRKIGCIQTVLTILVFTLCKEEKF
jgi:hypothetical protein